MDYQQMQIEEVHLNGQLQPQLDQMLLLQPFLISKPYRFGEENSWMNQYLNDDVLKENQEEDEVVRVSSFQMSAQGNETRQDTKQVRKEENQNGKKNRSIFHNVQKHLITYLRKIHLRRIDLVNKPSGLRAYELWKIFKSSKEYTKKCLYMIFGAEGSHNASNLLKMAASLPELSKMVHHYSMCEIQMAQAVIRQAVRFEVSHTPKGAIQSQCKMSKFQQFYDYLQAFLEELSESGLSMRVRKQQKQKVMQRRGRSILEEDLVFTE